MIVHSVTDPSVWLVVVVVPARDEEQRIGPCLDALRACIEALDSDPARRREVRTVVVLDRCGDRTAEVVARHPWAQAVISSEGRVGAARAIGVRAALSAAGVAPERIWIATTDADSRVPADWLRHQLELADQGADLFRGLVEPDPAECGPAAYDAWSRTYDRTDGHPHVHGANLGVRASAYLQCGGFDELAAIDEDVQLSQSVQLSRGRVVASAQARVATSGRRHGRVEGKGFAGFLRELDRPGEPVSTGADAGSTAP